MAEKPVRRILGESLSVQGVDVNDPNYWKGYEDLHQAITDYYSGRGFPLELLEKYYGYGKSLTVKPRSF